MNESIFKVSNCCYQLVALGVLQSRLKCADGEDFLFFDSNHNLSALSEEFGTMFN